jgi:uncharacterized protein
MDDAQNQNMDMGNSTDMVDLSPESMDIHDEGRPSISSEQLTEFIKHIVVNIVTDPSQVEILVNEEVGGSFTVTIKVAAEDKGRVIGKKGNTINAIRSLVRVFGKIMVLLQD